MNPIVLFEKWFSEEKKLNNLRLPAACCLSSTGLDGYPNARFVSLKETLNEYFVITGSLTSRKGEEIEESPKVALSFWWTETKRQVRIQGDVITIPKTEAEAYFNKRNRDSKIVSASFEQGKTIHSIETIQKQFEEQKTKFKNKDIKVPDGWGGIYIKPIRIEFMEFRESRLHERTLYQLVDNDWKKNILQP